MPSLPTAPLPALFLALLAVSGCLPDFPGDSDDDASDDDVADDDAADDDAADDDASDDDAADDDAADDDAADDDSGSTPEEDLAWVAGEAWSGVELDHLDFDATAEANGYWDCTWEWDVAGDLEVTPTGSLCEECAVVFHVRGTPLPDDCIVGSYVNDSWYGIELLGDRRGVLWSKGSQNGGWTDWCEVTLDAPGEIRYFCANGGSGTIGEDSGSFTGEVEGTATLK
ncbi:hypothetical protein L6R50_01145 [Myxococcota bacterium]|nr:hypothetical protein [Myxococcota bacterium]